MRAASTDIKGGGTGDCSDLNRGVKALRLLLIQGREDIGPEEQWVILLLIQRQPSHLSLSRWQGLGPSGQEVVLPKPAGAETRRERILEALVEQGTQMRTPDQRPGGCLHREFGCQQIGSWIISMGFYDRLPGPCLQLSTASISDRFARKIYFLANQP